MTDFWKIIIQNTPNFIGFIVLAWVQNENAIRTHALLLELIAQVR